MIGKDILKFHTVFWPAMLMAAELPLPEHVFVHGFLLGGDGRKMSKSLGNVLDPFEAMDGYGVDALRYYLSRDVQFGADGSVSIDALAARYDGELANELGNLASRSIAMLRRYRDGNVPDGELDLTDEFGGLCEDVATRLDGADLTGALEAIWQRVRRLNRYVEEQAPWTLAKDEARRPTSIACCGRWPRACGRSPFWSGRGSRLRRQAAGRARPPRHHVCESAPAAGAEGRRISDGGS